MGSDDAFEFLKEHPGTKMAQKKPAGELPVGQSFLWRGERYHIVSDYDNENDQDRLIVHREGANENEYFNAYCEVYTI